jgi:hypothetical protein
MRAFTALAMLAGLASCGYTPVAPEDRPAGFANTPEGLLVVEAHVEMSEGMRTPMDHSTPLRIDGMAFRAWLTKGDTLREIKVPYRYQHGDGPEPQSVVPVDGKLVPLTCHWGSPLRLADGALRCADLSEPPAVMLLGGRPMRFGIAGTRLTFGRDNRCTVDLAAIDPAASQPLVSPILEDTPDPWPSARFGLARIDESRAYLAALALPDVPLFLLDCSKAVPLGTAFDTGRPFEHDRLYVVDMVPDGSLRTPAVLRSERMDDPPPPYAMTVRRAGGKVFSYDRVAADQPLVWTFNGLDGGPTAFFGSDPSTLVFDARILREGARTSAELHLVDVATGEERTRIVAAPSVAGEQGP